MRLDSQTENKVSADIDADWLVKIEQNCLSWQHLIAVQNQGALCFISLTNVFLHLYPSLHTGDPILQPPICNLISQPPLILLLTIKDPESKDFIHRALTSQTDLLLASLWHDVHKSVVAVSFFPSNISLLYYNKSRINKFVNLVSFAGY